MNEYITAAKDLTPFIPLAKPLIETIFKDKLESLSRWLKEQKLESQIFEHKIFESAFQEYLCRILHKCSIMDTLIFPNQQIEINDIYQPLNLVVQSVNDKQNYRIDKYPKDLFNKYDKIIVVDNAGMGKSTLSKFITLHSIKSKKRIPIFIELRKINRENKLIDEILNQLNSIDKIFDKDFIFRLLKLGEFLIILDGYDEINSNDQQSVTNDIRDFVAKSSNNNFLLTSRPEGSIATFGDFQRTNIKGLKKEEAYELFNKYDKISKKELSKNLIREIRTVNNQIRDFLTNPFLVSLLYKTYSFKRDIPSRKSTFYNEVYTALYQDHDLSKNAYKRDKFSKLDIQDFRLVLREFAILTSKKGEVEYSEVEAVQNIIECKKKLSFLEFKESLFLKDLLSTVPLFIKDGNNVKWSHKSIQDYFSAEYLTYHPKKDEIINYLIKKDLKKYFNIIDLLVELDPNLIRHYVLPKMLKNLIEHFEKSANYDNIPIFEQQLRKMLTFETRFWANMSLINDRNLDNSDEDEFQRVNNFLKENFQTKFDGAAQFASKLFICYQRSNSALFIQLLGSKGLLGKSIFKNNGNLGELNAEMFSISPVQIDTNDKNAFYNQPKLYSSTSKILLSISSTDLRLNDFFVPDIDFCKKLLTELQNEIKENSKENYLDDY